MLEVFDETALLEQVDGDMEFLAETVAMLDEDCPALLEQIQGAAATGDAEGLARSDHTLKGMLANFCAESAETAARELETIGREGRMAGVEAASDRVRRETSRLQEALHEFLRS